MKRLIDWLFSLVVFGLLSWFLLNWTFSFKGENFFQGILFIASCITLAIIITVLLGWGPRLLVRKFQAGMHDVLMSGNRVLHLLESDELYWRWTAIRQGLHAKEFRTRGQVKTHLHPITENPKVRDLHYDVVTELAGTDQTALQAAYDRWHGGHWSQEVERILYDINELRSRELSVFFNPLDPDQQERFRAVIEEDLVPRIAPLGLKVSHVSFWLN